jgi:hypothetical protein
MDREELIRSGLAAGSVILVLIAAVLLLPWLNHRPRKTTRAPAPSPKPPRPRKVRRGPAVPPDLRVTPESVVVDGSNVMYWDDQQPTAGAVQKVLDALRVAGKDPILCFDANVGYRLAQQPLDRSELALLFGVSPSQLVLCPSRTDGDATILRIATTHNLPVVSNDGYRDYPDLVGKVRLMPGSIVKGQARVLLNPGPARGS